MKFRLVNFIWPTESEAAANHAGMNTFFGAVLGFVMAGTERLDAMEFAYVLFIVAGTVISILYISASKQKLSYGALTILLVLLLPRIVDPTLDQGAMLPDKLQPTLLVWTIMSLLVEVLPRRRDDSPTPAVEQKPAASPGNA